MPLNAPPRPGEIAVWTVELDAAPPPPGALAPDEQAAVARILDPRRRARAAAGRWARRRILAALVATDPAALRFAAGPHGKPRLAQPATHPLRFSVSHTGALLVVAVAIGREVGVDAEYRRAGRDPMRLAQVGLPPEQAARIAASSEETREALFHRLWVRHEARVKCHGVGLGTPVPAGARDVVVDLDLRPGVWTALAAAGEEPFATVVHDVACLQ
jgi:4'-phosphopantetheinyl transferase